MEEEHEENIHESLNNESSNIDRERSKDKPQHVIPGIHLTNLDIEKLSVLPEYEKICLYPPHFLGMNYQQDDQDITGDSWR